MVSRQHGRTRTFLPFSVWGIWHGSPLCPLHTSCFKSISTPRNLFQSFLHTCQHQTRHLPLPHLLPALLLTLYHLVTYHMTHHLSLPLLCDSPLIFPKTLSDTTSAMASASEQCSTLPSQHLDLSMDMSLFPTTQPSAGQSLLRGDSLPISTPPQASNSLLPGQSLSATHTPVSDIPTHTHCSPVQTFVLN